MLKKFFKKANEAYPAGPITILTEPPRRFGGSIASLFRSITGRFSRLGINEAQETLISLKKGCASAKIPVRINPREWKVTDRIAVISGIDTLMWALEAKRKRLIRQLIVSSSIVKTPADYNSIIKDVMIDAVMVPSETKKNDWISSDQSFDRKAVVWASGAHDEGAGKSPNGVCIVYSKGAPEKIFSKIMEVLWSHKVAIVISEYGRFKASEYIRLLKKAKFVIYLSHFDAQELGLFQAWLSDVPALVWQKSAFRPVPYLNEAAAIAFSGEDDFEARLLELQEKYNLFTPRNYARNRFTDVITARTFAALFENLKPLPK